MKKKPKKQFLLSVKVKLSEFKQLPNQTVQVQQTHQLKVSTCSSVFAFTLPKVET